MSSQACTVLPNDKEPGYTVVSVEDVLSIHQSILSKSCYVEVDPDLWVEGTMLKEYRILCSAVAGVEGDLRFSSMLGRSTRAERGEIPARLVLTCKSTKNPVDFRNVHAASSNWWAGLSTWLAFVLESQLTTFVHLLRDSKQLADELRGMRIEPHERMMRVDIKDFFMSGDADSLVVDACSIIPSEAKRRVAERVAFFLLRHQLIRSDLLPGRLWRVIKGSGRGLKHSSALCDAALFAKCERPFILNPVAASALGVRFYRRFKDDMFANVGDPGKAGVWLHCVRQRCKGTFFYSLVKVAPSRKSQCLL